MRNFVTLILAGCVLTLAGAACGGGDSYGSSASAPTPTSAVAGVSNAGATGAAVVQIASTSKGNVLADTRGMTLYTFDEDHAGSGLSACTGSCASNWPPADAPDGTPAKPGGLAADLGVISRPDDGAKQLTYGGRPLYRFAGDHSIGDTTGDGSGGLWHAVFVQSAGTASPVTADQGVYSGY
jgi:predicted lipoprotein with Yx(FWY)xxD motif